MTTTIYGKAWLALLSRINQWTETSFMLPETVFNPSANSPYIIIQPVSLISVDRGVQYNCGNELNGFLGAGVMVPLGWSFASHAGLAGRFCDHFLYGWQYNYSDCTVTIHQRPYIDGSPRREEAWNRLDVRIPWRTWG